MKLLNHKQIIDISKTIAEIINHDFTTDQIIIYPIPRGGIPAAYLVYGHLQKLTKNCKIVDNPVEANVFIDDLIDSGKTRNRYLNKYKNKKFYALYEKGVNIIEDWIVFPWEDNKESSMEDIPIRLLQTLNQDVEKNQKFIKSFTTLWEEVGKFS